MPTNTKGEKLIEQHTLPWIEPHRKGHSDVAEVIHCPPTTEWFECIPYRHPNGTKIKCITKSGKMAKCTWCLDDTPEIVNSLPGALSIAWELFFQLHTQEECERAVG